MQERRAGIPAVSDTEKRPPFKAAFPNTYAAKRDVQPVKTQKFQLIKTQKFQLPNTTVKQHTFDNTPSLSSYLEMEGVVHNKEILEFDFCKFAGGYKESYFDMYFPNKGIKLPIPIENYSSDTFANIEHIWPYKCSGLWRTYIGNVVKECGTWGNRWSLPEDCLIPNDELMIAAVLQIDRKILKASFKRLYGSTLNEDSWITEDQLLTVAFALWNPPFRIYQQRQTWAGFVDALNCRQSIRDQQNARRAAQIADLIKGELG